MAIVSVLPVIALMTGILLVTHSWKTTNTTTDHLNFKNHFYNFCSAYRSFANVKKYTEE